MAIDQLQADLLVVVSIGNYILAGLSSLGDSVSESELAVSGRNIYSSNYIIESVPKGLLNKLPEARVHLENCVKETKACDFPTL